MLSIAIIGYGPRGENVFARFLEMNKDKVKIVAIAELNSEKLNRGKIRFELDNDKCFNDADDFFAKGKMADAVIISTNDRTHFKFATKAAQLGYHIYLEKPISPLIEECIEMVAIIKKSGVISTVAHELRYSVAYMKLKEIYETGIIGKVQHIFQTENVGYWHQIHSFVRGVWQNSKTSSPMILAKCCHDADIILWLFEGDTPLRLSSFGSTGVYKKEMAPQGHTDYCLNGCKVKQNCPYDCEKYYLRKDIPASAPDYIRTQPNFRFMITEDQTEEGIYKALRETQFGKCVYECENDVVDHQIVNMEFESGMTATLTMVGQTYENGRQTRILGSLGELYYNEFENRIYVKEFGKSDYIIELSEFADQEYYSHDKADKNLVEEFIKCLMDAEKGEKPKISSAIDKSLLGHVLCFAAEESRLSKGKVIEIAEYIENANSKTGQT